MRTSAALLLVLAGVLAVDSDSVFSIVTVGSAIKLLNPASKHRLHSHDINWGSGSGQQSVTAVRTDGDSNSLWTVYLGFGSQQRASGSPIACGEVLRFKHVRTGKFLHSHLHKSPLSSQQEVSGFPDQSNSDDNWTLECSEDYWKRDQVVKLRHASTKAYLSTSSSYEFNARNCGRNCPIGGQYEVSASSKSGNNAKWTAAEGLYVSVPDDFDLDEAM